MMDHLSEQLKKLNSEFPCPNGVLCKFGQNPLIVSGDDKAHFYSLSSVVTLKIKSRSPKSNQFF